jgi:hypothetical protein
VGRNTRWLIIIPAVFFALFAKPAKADVLGNWTFSQSQNCGGSIEVIDNTIILHGPDNGTQQFGMCGGQAHWVKIETVIPAGVNTVDFKWAYQTNDGWVYDPPQYGINGVYTLLTQQNNATGIKSIPVQEGDTFTFRQYSIDTCCQPGHLSISNLSLWEFTTTSTTSTTTTTTTSTVPSTTVPVTNPTTTTVQETTTTSSTTTTTVPETTSTQETISSVTSTSSLPQISEPTTVAPYVPEVPVEVPTGTTTTLVEEPTPEVTLPEETTTTTEPSSETYPDTTQEPVVDTTLPEVTDTPLEAPLSDEEVENILVEAETAEALVEALADLAPEQVAQVVEALLAGEPSQEQATALATSPEVLAIVSTEQAAQIFEALDVAELSDAQTEELIAAVQTAPTAIRETFEDTIDIFKSALDTYVPVGSNIPVGTRRTLIAVTAGLTLAAAGTRIRRQ